MGRSQSAAIYGLSGPALSEWEKGFFREVNPLGFILFKRNIQDKDQVRMLTDSLRELLGRREVPILIDQEGGRVQRLQPPIWRAVPPAGLFAALAKKNYEKALLAAELNARLIAMDLSELGITVDCAPVVDMLHDEAHDIVGDRSYGKSPQQVTDFAKSVMKGFLAHGIDPIIKHIPGHGRALVDSHQDLPVVKARRNELEAHDFQVFCALKDSPWAMTAHIIYTAIDADFPATTSKTVIQEVIRGYIGFDNLLISDDLSMKALRGSFCDRAREALRAGCDIVLHCNGVQTEMLDMAKGVEDIGEKTHQRLGNNMHRNANSRQSAGDVLEVQDRLKDIFKKHDLNDWIA